MTFKIYQDEPIPKTAISAAGAMPPRYRKMRNLASGYDLCRQSDTMIFYQQARLMEDFEDEFDFTGEFIRYFPTYQAMNDRQLRGYFSWRTRVRRGIVEPTSLSFVFVYLYELLNQIGTGSPEEGFHTLKNFWRAYREIDAKIDHYVKLWLKDYAVYHNLDRTLLEDVLETDFDKAALTLLNYQSHSADEVFRALHSLSSYNLENSRFFRQYPDDVKAVVYHVFARLSDYYGKNRKNSLCEKFFGKIYASSYYMFRSAVFYDKLKRQDFVYEINDIHKYHCRNGRWSCERFLCYKGKIQQTGALLKIIDFLMRQKYHFKSGLKAEKITKLYQDIINQEIEKYQADQKRRALPRIEIDVSRLQTIRQAALETQSKLLVEALEDAGEPDTSGEPGVPANRFNLSDAEYRLLSGLLYGKTDGAPAAGQLLSVTIDAINEKLFDEFGDTVIAYDGEKPELIEDYVAELKGIIQG